MRKRLSAILFALVIIFTSTHVFVFLHADELKPFESSNAFKNNYWYHANWAENITSNLYAEGPNFVRVEYVYDGVPRVLVENYDEKFNIVSSKKIDMELPIWGGFYNGKDFNFLIFGDENYWESNDKEVVRVVKYDKNWNRIGHASLKGANTTVPFQSGSLRCAEHKGMLYIRTSHRMYAKNGVRHQANLTMAVRETDMTITDSVHSAIGNSGYASHSFNQFILVDKDENLLALDHGDAYPRSISLTKYPDKAGGDNLIPSSWDKKCQNVDIVKFEGQIGDNYTGAQIGGFTETEYGYLVSYKYGYNNTEPNNKSYVEDSINKNIYLTYIPKDDINNINTKLVYTVGANPILVPLDLESGYMLWNDDKGLLFTKYDSKGNIGDVFEVKGVPLSDCKPIKYKGGILWYFTEDSEPTFVYLNDEGTRDIKQNPIEGDFEDINNSPFKDVNKGHWFYKGIKYCYDKGYVYGVGNDKFSPSGRATREAFATILYRLSGDTISAEEKNTPSPFTDLSYDANNECWSCEAIKWANSRGIVYGTSKSTFSPKKNITNEQIVTLLYRYSKSKGYNLNDRVESLTPYKDYQDVSDYALDPLKWAIANDIIKTEGSWFIPKEDASRAELAYMLYKFSEFIENTSF